MRPFLPHTVLSLLSLISQVVLSISFSIKTAPNLGLNKIPSRSQVNLNGRPTRPPRTITVLCGVWGAPLDFQLHRALKPLMNSDFIREKNGNPYLFRWREPTVTIFVCSVGSCTKAVRNLHEKACRTDIRLAEFEKMLSFCSRRVPIY